MPGNRWRHGTPLGFFFTLSLVIVLLLQGYLKAERVFGFGDTKTIQSYQNNYYNDTFVYSSDAGLKFAFGVTAYDNNRENIEDPDYGVVKAKVNSWGLSDSNEVIARSNFDTHPCTKEELGLDEDRNDESSEFWPIIPYAYD